MPELGVRKNRLNLEPVFISTNKEKDALFESIRDADSPFLAANIVAEFSVAHAVAIVDNLDHLTAAFIFLAFSIRAAGNEKYAKRFVAEGRKHEIRGSAGLVYARDEVYRETGYLAGL